MNRFTDDTVFSGLVKTLAVVRKSHHRGGGAITFLVWDDDGLATLHDSNH
jgi:hypothetical protein